MQGLLNFVFLLKLIVAINANHYEIKLNSSVPNPSDYIIQFFNMNINYQCLLECDKLDDCLVCGFDQSKTGINCILYTQGFDENQLVPSPTADLYFKKIPRLLDIFKNPQKIATKVITDGVNDDSRNFQVYVDSYNNVYNYLARKTSINVYDVDWNFVTTYKTPSSSVCLYMIIVENKDVYLSLFNNIVKTNVSLNVIKQLNSTSNSYRQIFYYKKTDSIYATNTLNLRIDIFNRELDRVDSIYTGRNNHAVYLHYDDMYVGTNGGVFMKYRNKTLISQIQSKNCTDYIFSIFIDKYGYMSLACKSIGFMLYHTNGTFMNMSIVMSQPRNLNFDSKLQMITTNPKTIDIYKRN